MLKDSQVSLTAFAEAGRTEKSTDGIPLPALGKSTVGELAAGEANTYLITLNQGQYMSAVIERRDLDIRVQLYDPVGGVLFQVDCRQSSLTPVSLIAQSSGVYRLEVRPLEKEQVRGHYELHVEEIRPAKAEDSHRIAAQTAVAEGQQLLREWKEESSLRAISKFKDSLQLWRAAGDGRWRQKSSPQVVLDPAKVVAGIDSLQLHKEREALQARVAAMEQDRLELQSLRQERKDVLTQVDGILKELDKLDL
jgi:hypothetical protein